MTWTSKARKIFPRNVKIKLLLLLVGVIAGAFIETLTLSAVQPLILVITDPTVVYTNPFIGTVYNLLNFTNITVFLAFLAIVVALVYAFRGFYVYFFTRIQNRFMAKNTAIMSNRLLIKTLNQPYLYHVNNNVVELQQIVLNNSTRLFALVGNILQLLIDGFMSLFILAFLMITSFSMTLIVLLFATTCIVVYFKIFKNRIQKTGEDEARGIIQINKSVLQALYGVKEIKISRKENYFTDKFQQIRIKTIETAERIQTLRQLPKLFIESLCFSGAFLVLAGVILSGVEMETLIPQLGLFMLAAFKLLPAISRLVSNITQILRQKSSVDSVYSGLFEQDPLLSHLPIKPTVSGNSYDIVISNVKFKYPKARKFVLGNVSMIIPHNKSVALIGKSGAGKSTLVDIVLGILAPHEGSVTYNGKSIHHDFESWANNVGYIPQVIYLLDESIIENVAFGIAKNEINEAKVWQALEQAQLKEYVESLPEGLQTEIGERGVRLSGGQRQRIGIARALYSDPEILVLDEATSSLDNDTEKSVMDAIQGLQGSKTMLIVAHRLSTIEHCDMIYKVEKGAAVQVR